MSEGWQCAVRRLIQQLCKPQRHAASLVQSGASQNDHAMSRHVSHLIQ